MPDLRGKVLSLSPKYVNCRFFVDARQQAEEVGLNSFFFSWQVLKRVGVGFCPMCFLHWLLWFSFFTLLKWWNILIRFWILNHPSNPEINSIRSWCIYFMYMYMISCCWILFADILLITFAYILIRAISLYFSFLYFLWFWYR